MLFNSLEFFWFFAVVYVLYRAIGSVRYQNRMLLIASYIFYGCWDIRFLYLVVVSTGLDYCCGLILGPGKIPRLDRIKVSVCLISASFFFVFVPWSRLAGFDVSPTSSASNLAFSSSWLPLIDSFGSLLVSSSNRVGIWVFLGTIAAVLVANVLYLPLADLPERRRKHVGLLMTISANLMFLGFFKYFNFFIESFESLLRLAGVSAISSQFVHIVLPAGISFYTFQSLSYTIDVYRNKTKAVDRLEDYALFVMFFPVLVAGPIERAGHMMPKLTTARAITIDQTCRGLFLVLFGLFKKVAIADGLAPSVNSIFDSTGNSTWADVCLASCLFAFQIYCDFSGYTDIARGLAKMMGFDLLLNFNLPYFSRSPSEFWQRWHISLSSWLRDYLYIPLGGNRLGTATTYRNLMITMLLGGLWHGASWTYVLWGGYHGSLLSLYRLVQPSSSRIPASARGPVARSLGAVASVALFFALTCYGWLLFRARSLTQVLHLTNTVITGFGDLHTTLKQPMFAAIVGLPVLILYETLEFAAGCRTHYRAWPVPVRAAFYALMIVLILMGMSNEPTQFIYFQF
jgi:D-alanyl-lipoteichoic acid acyltransferase DltB (MBOAT superfamily)